MGGGGSVWGPGSHTQAVLQGGWRLCMGPRQSYTGSAARWVEALYGAQAVIHRQCCKVGGGSVWGPGSHTQAVLQGGWMLCVGPRQSYTGSTARWVEALYGVQAVIHRQYCKVGGGSVWGPGSDCGHF